MVLLCFVMQLCFRIDWPYHSTRKCKVPFMSGLFCPTGQIAVQTSAHSLLNLSCVSAWKRSFIFPWQIYLAHDGLCYPLQANHPKLNFKDKYSESYRDAHPTAPVVVPWMSGVISAWANSLPAAQLRFVLMQMQLRHSHTFFYFFFFFLATILPCFSSPLWPGIYDVKLSLVDSGAKVFQGWCWSTVGIGSGELDSYTSYLPTLLLNLVDVFVIMSSCGAHLWSRAPPE